MNYMFIAGINYLRFNTPVGKGYELNDQLRITNSPTVADRLMSDNFRSTVRVVESSSLLEGKPFVYAESEYPLADTSPDRHLQLLDEHLAITNFFFNLLWMIKDNSANLDLGFIEYPHPSSLGTKVSSNRRSVLFTNNAGEAHDVTFSIDEISDAAGHFHAIPSPMSSDGPTGDVDRVSRVFYFLQSARHANFLPEKIASYCTCFETLVSTDSVELSHKVAERVAVLLSNRSSESVEIYNNVRKAYDTRSKLVHGASLRSSSVEYKIQSLNCDEYLRRLLWRIWDDQVLHDTLNQTSRVINEYFATRILGEPKD